MTIEEKARAYDEALEQARFYYNNKPLEPEKKKLEKMFPQLIENETDKMKRTIKLALIASEDELSAFYSTHGVTRKECTDWLEKQGWRPNEKQLKALEDIVDLKMAYNATDLHSLWVDLTKL